MDSHRFQYPAGIFDAEGSLSLNPNGSFPISLEITNEEIPKLFQELFAGSIYIRQREDRKKTWTWKINSINEQAVFFLKSMIPYSTIKKPQMICLLNYLMCSRDDRREIRKQTVKDIKNLKQPIPENKLSTIRLDSDLTLDFEMWLAGLFDGDGNFVCNVYRDNRNEKQYFARQISIASIYLDALVPINDVFEGTITKCPRSKNIVYKWMCKKAYEEAFCFSILPFLKIKKNQCMLFQDFSKTISDDDKFRIIDQIKHLNSL